MPRTSLPRCAPLLFAALCAVTASPALGAQRAFVVGIDTYLPPAGRTFSHPGRGGNFTDLKGAAADAQGVHALLIARYGFDPASARLVRNREATRAAILDGLNNHLAGAAKGDTAFFYYAGHGSQVRNSKSRERNRLDESIVPSDSWNGVPDVRDKELARAFHKILDAGIRLVVIFDSCHSGSASRGPAGSADAAGMRPRKAHPSDLDAADDYEPPSWVGKDFMSMSAAQDFQLAWESWDDQGNPRGLFSLSLQRAMQTASPAEPAELLFRRIQSSVSTARDDQDPVIEGDPVRLAKPLFAEIAGAGAGQPVRTVVGVTGVGGGVVELGAGSVVGLTPGAELVPLGQGGPKGLRLRVDKVQGPTRSTASAIAGAIGAVKGGLLLTVDRWGRPAASALRLHAPPAELSVADLAAAATALRKRAGAKVVWVDDPTTTAPTHVIARKGGAWVLEGPDGGRTVTKDTDLAKLAGPGAKLFVNLPTAKELDSKLDVGPKAALSPAARSDYHLAGRWASGRVEYAWVRPWGGREPGGAQTTLPVRTDWLDATRPDQAAHDLSQRAERLGTVHHWLTTDGPPGDGSFPYQLAIYDADTPDKRTAYKVSGTLTEGTRYNLSLVATRPVTGPKSRGRVTPRYVYVFVLDKDGKSTVILPFPGKGDVENLFPPPSDQQAPKGTYKLLDEDIAWVGPPYGTDTYVLLTTRTKLPDHRILEGEAVRSRGVATGGTADTADWSIRRVVVQSAPRPAP